MSCFPSGRCTFRATSWEAFDKKTGCRLNVLECVGENDARVFRWVITGPELFLEGGTCKQLSSARRGAVRALGRYERKQPLLPGVSDDA